MIGIISLYLLVGIFFWGVEKGAYPSTQMNPIVMILTWPVMFVICAIAKAAELFYDMGVDIGEKFK